MTAKLIKTIDGYELFTQGFLKGSTNHGLIDSLNVEEGSIRYKLSLKNCQEIERGYDLDELAMGYDLYENINFVGQMRAYKAGFQKAIELIGDKKFNENDLLDCWNTATKPSNTYAKWFVSLQQTEWDVEIEMICPHPKDTYVCGIQYGCDEDGCLILKRI